MPTPETNAKILASISREAPVLHREMIKELIRAYRNQKIKNYSEVERVVLLLSSKNTELKRSGRPMIPYLAIMQRNGLIAKPPPEEPEVQFKNKKLRL